LFSSEPLLAGRSNTQNSSSDLGGGGPLKQSTVAVTSPQSSASSQHVLRRGNSAENLASVQQHVNSRLDTQIAAPAPNGTLKKLKTGKEQVSPYFGFWCWCC
jgi:hypothetical protein